MPILVDELSVWDIGFRIAGYDPRRFYFRIPLEVEDHFRNLIGAIHKGELSCLTISLEKRKYEPDEKKFSIYYWIDDFFACTNGQHFDRKLLRWALVERLDLMLWCERMNIPLPEFWFPPGWNLSYALPDGELYPGHGYEMKYWPPEEREAWRKDRDAKAAEKAKVEAGQLPNNEIDNPDSPHTEKTNPTDEAAKKMRPNQEVRIACQQIAKTIWMREPDRTIASVVKDELIQVYGGGGHFFPETIREWIKVVAPPHVRNRRGAPRKNRGEEK